MNRKAIAAVVAAAAVSLSAWSLAADKPAAQGMHGMQGMQGMHGMMSGCPMIGGGKMGEIASKYAAQVK
jgi:hypothetical protein